MCNKSKTCPRLNGNNKTKPNISSTKTNKKPSLEERRENPFECPPFITLSLFVDVVVVVSSCASNVSIIPYTPYSPGAPRFSSHAIAYTSSHRARVRVRN